MQKHIIFDELFENGYELSKHMRSMLSVRHDVDVYSDGIEF